MLGKSCKQGRAATRINIYQNKSLSTPEQTVALKKLMVISLQLHCIRINLHLHLHLCRYVRQMIPNTLACHQFTNNLAPNCIL